MTVIRVLTHADVGDHDELRQLLLERAHRLRNRTVVVPCAGAFRILGCRNAEEQHTADAEGGGCPRIDEELVDGSLVDPRHGAHWLPHTCSRTNEQGQHELRRCEDRFANERTQRRCPTQSAWTILGIAGHSTLAVATEDDSRDGGPRGCRSPLHREAGWRDGCLPTRDRHRR